mmetsp:Transcript_10562/g.18557  ORF Transcript_10562/g.18557 Transcript_10562/m.18557 type:complete len:108 (+) Transcript_10562:191-514(+)
MMTKSVNPDTAKVKKIIVPTLRHKPLRLKHYSKNSRSNQDSPFLHFSLTHKLGKCFAVENASNDNSADDQSGIHARFPVEGHPLYMENDPLRDAMLEMLFQGVQDSR